MRAPLITPRACASALAVSNAIYTWLLPLYLKVVFLWPYVPFRNEALTHQTAWDDIIDRIEWGIQVGESEVWR